MFTTLYKYYQNPVIKPPLDNDPGNDGSPSDHKIVYIEPLTNLSFLPARTKKTVKFRPLPQSGINLLGQWMVKQDWQEIYEIETAHEDDKLNKLVLSLSPANIKWHLTFLLATLIGIL